jgi:hypothetical protein
MNTRLAVRTDERMVVIDSQPKGRKAWTPSANSCWRMPTQSWMGCDVWPSSPSRPLSLWTEGSKDEDLNRMEEAIEVREALETVQALSIEVSEELDAYQDRHAR